ncbi:hypothetical protein B4119_0247 [Parageobacillus caldoxylosilyticus]|jgi:hypothetical protein|uniref:Uncharacterized protein n=1 Tax=Saccharococcus caldoxylosilyticus TaxID=81408 RepID=A0A150KWL0_9BACL|nr:hypothetical protein B4119_0247 [Parageobacillus caldoxylosilyticus]MBB3853073.1 hypothetical protein [Parageobacillus caldoxylosilyticus]
MNPLRVASTHLASWRRLAEEEAASIPKSCLLLGFIIPQ